MCFKGTPIAMDRNSLSARTLAFFTSANATGIIFGFTERMTTSDRSTTGAFSCVEVAPRLYDENKLLILQMRRVNINFKYNIIQWRLVV